MKSDIMLISEEELRERYARFMRDQRRRSPHYKLFQRIHSKLCSINGGVCGGETEFVRTEAVMKILVRAKLVPKMP